jgi:hypothetical protein
MLRREAGAKGPERAAVPLNSDKRKKSRLFGRYSIETTFPPLYDGYRRREALTNI